VGKPERRRPLGRLRRRWEDNINPLKPNDPYKGRTAPLTSKRYILYIYSTNLGTEYFKHVIYSSFFFSSKCSLFHNSNVFGSCIIHILYTGVPKLKKNNSGAKRLIVQDRHSNFVVCAGGADKSLGRLGWTQTNVYVRRA